MKKLANIPLLRRKSLGLGILEESYDVGDTLALDEYATIYKVVRQEDGKQLACMELKNKDVDQEAIVKSKFQKLKDISHPNIISHVDSISDYKFTYIIMEPMPGNVLLEKMGEHEPVTEAKVVRIIKQVLDACDYLHKHGIVHRDLNPEHLFFKDDSSESPIMLCGFGMAAVCKDAYRSGSLKGICGRYGFISPERFLEEPRYNAKVDIWSIGVITYILLSGELPFTSNKRQEYLDQIENSSTTLFNSKIWDKISENAKDFNYFLLKAESSGRPTAAEAMEHIWIRDDALDIPLIGKEQLFRTRDDVKKRELFAKADSMRRLSDLGLF